MANYCIFCGEEIPEDHAICDICPAILNNLPPKQQKKMQRVIENEMAMIELRRALYDVKQRLKIALAPVVEAICDFIDTVIAVTEVTDDGQS